MTTNKEYYSQLEKVRQENIGLSDFIFGKAQPSALPIEEAVLGALLLDSNAIRTVIEILSVESFYTEANQAIYKAITELFKGAKPVDLLTVTEELRKMGAIEIVGGAYHLIELTNRVGSAANIEYHARILVQKEIAREGIKKATQQIRDYYDESSDVFQILENGRTYQRNLEDIPNRVLPATSLSDVGRRVIEKLFKAKSGELTGVNTGFPSINAITNGWQRKDLIIIAARPSMGKTLVSCNLAIRAMLQGHRVAFFSVEMTDEQIMRRMASAMSGVNKGAIEGKESLSTENEAAFIGAIEKFISDGLLEIDDTPNLTSSQLTSKLYRFNKTKKVDLVIVDYLQKMKGENLSYGANREREISSISAALKTIAKLNDVPVIALAQLSRAVETRGGTKKPQLSDLRDSGSIEQDADVVTFIYRPEYYQILEDENGNPTKNIIQLLTMKNREGRLGDLSFNCDLDMQRMSELNEMTNDYATSVAPIQNIITGIRGTFDEETDTILKIEETEIPF